MPDGLAFLMGVLLGLLIAISATVAYLHSQRSRVSTEEDADPVETESVQVSTVLAALPQAHIVLDENNDVVRASTLAYAYGLIRDSKVNADILELTDKVRTTGTIADTQMRLPSLGMDEFIARSVWVQAAPMGGNQTLVLFEDNTAKRRLEETRRDFIANVSHELKTPVGGIGLLAETIYQVVDEPENVRKFSRQMIAEAQRLSELVQGIIELSRLQEGDSLAGSTQVSIDEVVADAVERVRVEAEARLVELVAGGDQGLYVYGDRRRLTTAIRNLLDNAVRYSPPHGRVSVGISSVRDEVRIAVVDQGEGIPAEARNRIFERFYRGDQARSRETGGSGLGLSIVKHVVADHGGRIKLWSEVGKGSTFTIILPVIRPSVTAKSAAERSAGVSSAAGVLAATDVVAPNNEESK